MEKLTVKITLNPKNYLDAKLIQRLSEEENMAGALKTLAYERLVIQGLLVQVQGAEAPGTAKQAVAESMEISPAVDPDETDRQRRRQELELNVDQKLSKLENF